MAEKYYLLKQKLSTVVETDCNTKLFKLLDTQGPVVFTALELDIKNKASMFKDTLVPHVLSD